MRVAFAIEDHLGHRALLSNLRTQLAGESALEPVWLPLDPRGDSAWQRMPRIRDKHALIFGLKVRKALKEAEKRGRLDACFMHTQRMAHLAVDRMRHIPTFISIDATPGELDQTYRGLAGLKSERGSWYWGIRDSIHRRTYAAARGMISMSSTVANSLSRVYGVAPADVLVMLPSVDTTKWQPAERNTNGGPCRILFVGGDFERKGGDLLLRWAKETRQRDVRIDIVTSQPPEPTPGVTVHTNFKPNEPGLMDLMQQAHLLVLPTRADMSPWVVAEAKAAGTAVLSTTVGGIPELVRDGVDGWLVPPNDYARFSEQLDAAVADQEQLVAFGRRAREDAVERLDAAVTARRLLQFMRARL